jgi:citrate lyase subunit beta/citryl-CoA lyase
MKPYRSMLFVPGNRPSWIEKVHEYGTDAVILDLEDSVPDGEKVACGLLVKEGVKIIKSKKVSCYVRVNGFASGLTFDDFEGILCPELDGIMLPKIESADEMKALDILVTSLEKRQKLKAYIL